MKEKIEEAARDYATGLVKESHFLFRRVDEKKEESFIAGAEWMQKQSFGCSDAKKLNLALSALKNISDPILYIENEAKKDGSIIDRRGAVEFANNGVSISNMAKDALSKIKSIPLSIKSPWISVKDLMPQINHSIIILTEYGEIFNGNYSGKGGWFKMDGCEVEEFNGNHIYSSLFLINPEVVVTHWMPIPELPKGGER